MGIRLKKRRKKEGWMERLGLERVTELNMDVCLRRVHHLKRGLRRGWYESDPKLEYHARYYANWYGWVARNGGVRPEPKGKHSVESNSSKNIQHLETSEGSR